MQEKLFAGLAEYVTVAEAARLTGYSKPRIYQLVHAGQLSVAKAGNIFLLRRKEVLRFERKSS